jgi:hypothetical protein
MAPNKLNAKLNKIYLGLLVGIAVLSLANTLGNWVKQPIVFVTRLEACEANIVQMKSTDCAINEKLDKVLFLLAK